MTKAELIEVLKPFTDDVEITVGGCFPKVFYTPAGEHQASLNFEDEHYYCWPDDDCVQLFPGEDES